MLAIPVVRSEPYDVDFRLAQLGLSSAILRDALLAGELARSTCTANDPPAFAGFTFWGVTVRSVREHLIPLGWEKSDEGNYSRCISPNREMAIAVATGDDGTGLAHGSPKTKFPKGSATILAVELNAQLELWPQVVTSPTVEQAGPVQTWVLLTRRTEAEVRGELSLPLQMGDDGRIEVWSERIVLNPIALDDDQFFGLAQGPEPGPEFDVEVVPIAN